MTQFFSEDKRIGNVFDGAINSGVDAYDWRDHSQKHTPIANEIRLLIRKSLF